MTLAQLLDAAMSDHVMATSVLALYGLLCVLLYGKSRDAYAARFSPQPSLASDEGDRHGN